MATRLETFLALADERLVRMTTAWVQVTAGRAPQGALRDLARELHTLKGEARLMGYAAMADVAHALEDALAPFASAAPPPLRGPAADHVLRGLDLLGALLQRPADAPAPDADAFLGRAAHAAPGAPATPADPPPRARPAVRVSAAQVDRLRDLLGDLLLVRARVARSATELRAARDRAAAALPARSSAGAGPADGPAAALGALVDALSGLEARLRADDRQIDRLAAELDAASRGLRLVPLSALLDPWPREARDLARALGRQLRLEVHGHALEVDRAVADALAEPLLHLVRNAVDHGVEPPDVRRARGKPPEGLVTLSARLSADTLELSVTDDGAGVDLAAVRRRALERGLVPAAEAATLDEAATLRLLFAPGLSTRGAVTPTSGRGLGLDAALAGLEAIGGDLTVASTPGVGATFTIRAPIHLAVTPLLLFDVGPERYALRAMSVLSLVPAPPDAAATRAIAYEGALVPVLDLPTALDVPTSARASADGGPPRLVVVDSGGRRAALAGTTGHVERAMLTKSGHPVFAAHPLVRGVVPQDDGGLALALEVRALVALAYAPAAPPPSAPARLPTVLVADDSPVVRDLVADSLRAHGARVIEAADGAEALDRLRRSDDVDLVLTDIEMPHMDGLAFIRAARAAQADQGGRRVPILVVSMRGRDRDRERALAAGADGYLVKTDFSHLGLWSLIGPWLR